MHNSQNYMTADPFYYGLLKRFANENKRHQTIAEELLWNQLSGNPWGLHFRRQHIIGCYIADIICIKAKTIIEIDGGYHSQCTQQVNDYLRTTNLESLRYSVIRFTNDKVFTDLAVVLDEIFNHIVKRININK